jgi:hypothetical protein
MNVVWEIASSLTRQVPMPTTSASRQTGVHLQPLSGAEFLSPQ